MPRMLIGMEKIKSRDMVSIASLQLVLTVFRHCAFCDVTLAFPVYLCVIIANELMTLRSFLITAVLQLSVVDLLTF